MSSKAWGSEGGVGAASTSTTSQSPKSTGWNCLDARGQKRQRQLLECYKRFRRHENQWDQSEATRARRVHGACEVRPGTVWPMAYQCLCEPVI